MELSHADRRLVRALAGELADDVLVVLDSRSEVLVAMGGGVSNRSLRADLRDWLLLAARVLRSAARRRPSRFWDAMVLERAPKALSERLEYVARYRPSEHLIGVTATTSLLWPGLTASVRTLGALLVALLTHDRGAPTELSYRAVSVATGCLQAVGHARKAGAARVYLFRPYRLESPIIAGVLMREGIDVQVVVGTTPMAAHIPRIMGSRAVLCTAYQLDEMPVLEPLGPGAHCELWGPTEILAIERAYRGARFKEHPEDIGVYTQGFWVRILRKTIDETAARPHREHELRFLEAVARYAEEHPQVKIHLFPHPMERAWHSETGEHGYGRLPELDNVLCEFGSETSSINSFGLVGLGVTTTSTVGFDRLHVGLRTLFFVGDSDLVDPAVPSPYQRLFFFEEDELLEAMERARAISDAAFMAEHFDALYGDAWGPWSAESLIPALPSPHEAGVPRGTRP